MAKVRPYHTKTLEHPPERNVYHDHDNCPDGRHILPHNKETGTGNRPLCKECIKLGK
jgi:hypothetical protein